jgi:hypothetical protein
MSAAQPPKLATFLIERLAGGEPVLLGDLQEEYRSGRSRWWYWREALSVIAWSLVGAIRRHPVKFLRAIAALLIANGVAGYVVSTLFLESVDYVPAGWIYMRFQLHTVVWISLSFPICATATWSMARLHPEVRVPATLVVVAFAIPNVMGVGELQRLWANMPEPRFVPYFLRHVLGILVWLAALVAGGMFVPVRIRESVKTSM